MIMKTDGAYNLLVFLSNNIGIAFRLVPLLIDCLLARNQDKFQALLFFQLQQTIKMTNSFLDGGKLVTIQRLDPLCLRNGDRFWLSLHDGKFRTHHFDSLLLLSLHLHNQYKVLASSKPSSLDPLALVRRRKEQQSQRYGRLGYGGAVQVLSPGTAEKTLQDNYRIDYPEQPLPALEKANSPSTSTTSSSDSEEENQEDMVSSRRGTLTQDGKKYVVPKKAYEAMTNDLESAKQSIVKLQNEKKELQTMIKAKETEIGGLTAKLAKKRKSKAGSRRDEQSDDVREAVKAFIKGVLFRTVKFAQPGAELQAATTNVWNGIKGKLKLDEGPNPLSQADFVEIYDSYVLTVLSDCRQYAQTRGEVAAKGTIWCNLVFCSVYFTINDAVLTPFATIYTQNGLTNTVIYPLWRTFTTFGISLIHHPLTRIWTRIPPLPPSRPLMTLRGIN